MKEEAENGNQSRESKRSFNLFIGLIIIVMAITGFIAFWDNWGGDVVEFTGLGETKKIALPNDVKIFLKPESGIEFQKGAAHKIFLHGSADISVGMGVVTREVSVETTDITTETKEAEYTLVNDTEGTSIEVLEGRVQVIPKPDNGVSMYLEKGETYRHKLTENVND